MGDPASIGPEIAVKALKDKKIYEICRPLIAGDARVFEKIISELGLGVTINRIQEPAEAAFKYGAIDVIDLANVDISKLAYGKIDALCGEASFRSVEKVIQLALAGTVNATVTGPINKKSINDAGHHFAGHTEIYAELTGTKNMPCSW